MKLGRLVFWGLALACSKGGGPLGSDGGGGGGGGGVLSPEDKNVVGRDFFGEAPAGGFDLWVVDRSRGTYETHQLDADGRFELKLDQFVEGNTYSLHLLRDVTLIADIDLSAAVDGLQTAFLYEGGEGFDLGDVVVPIDAHGLVDSELGTTGIIGGGFSLRRDDDGRLAAFPRPAWLPTWTLGSQLIVLDPSAAFEAFYRRDQNPEGYGTSLAAHSRVGVLAISEEGAGQVRLRAESGGPWLSSTRVVSESDLFPSAGQFWSITGWQVPEVADGRYQVSLSTGGIAAPGSLLLMRALPSEGASAVVPLVVESVMALPPLVVGASANGATAVAIDYESDTVENGLTRPMCQAADVEIVVTPPVAVDGTLMGVGFGQLVEVELDYFGEAGGGTVPIAAEPGQFESPWDFTAIDQLPSGTVRIWNPESRRLTYLVSTSAFADGRQTLDIPKEVMPSSLGEPAVFKIRLRIYFRRDDSAEVGGIVFWLRKDC